MTDLPIDHVAHGHTNLHAHSLDVVEIEMMKNRQTDAGQGDARSGSVGLMDRSCVVGAVFSLKVLNYVPK